MLISVSSGRIQTVFLFVSGSLRITILANGCDTHIVMVLQDMSHQTASRLGLQVQCSQNAGIARIGLTPILPSIALSNIKYGTTLYYIIVVSNVYFYTPPVVLQKKYSILPSHVFCKYVCCHI